MKGKKLLSSLLVGATMFAMTVQSVSAEPYNAETTDTTGKSINTEYRTAEYIGEVEYYNVDIDYDDLYWTFVYEGDITNPDKGVWTSTSAYNLATNGKEGNELESEKRYILDHQVDNTVIFLKVTNNSGFKVNAQAEVVDKVETGTTYTTSAGLQIAFSDDYAELGTFQSEPLIKTLSNEAYQRYGVRPTATRFVNDSGDTAQVAGEIKLTFSKAE